MDEHRAQANEQLMDELSARVDELQRRFEGLIRTRSTRYVKSYGAAATKI